MFQRMFHWLILAVLLAATPAFAGSHHTILYYISSAAITEQTARPLVTYLDPDGNAIDWMYEGFIAFSIHIHGHHVTAAKLDTFRDALFQGGQLEALRAVVAAARIELDDPHYRLKVYLGAPYTTGEDPCARVQEMIDAWEAWNPEELELTGFYWGYQETVGSEEAANTIRTTADYLHARSLQLIWIPYFNASGVASWRTYRFDYATLQPNYAFRDVDKSRFLAADDRRRAYQMSGVELEIAEVNNPQVGGSDPRITNANDYLDAADTMNWSVLDQITYYHGSAIAAYATHPDRRQIYDRVYRFIAAHPNQPSVLHRRTVLAEADGFVDMAVGHQSNRNGHLSYLNLGSNGYPNALRVFLRFSLSDLQGDEAPLATYLRLQQRSFPYGSKLNDIQVRMVEAPWDQATLAGNNQPAMGAVVATHRFMPESTYPFEHVIDVTGAVASALQTGESSISFGLARALEDGTEAEAQLHSREAGDDLAPRLVAIYRQAPIDDVIPPDDHGPDVGIPPHNDPPDVAPPSDHWPDTGPFPDAGHPLDSGAPPNGDFPDTGASPDDYVPDFSNIPPHVPGTVNPQDPGVQGCGCRLTPRHKTQWPLLLMAIAALAPLVRLGSLGRMY